MVDFVGEDAQGLCLIDGLVEAGEQLEHGFSFSAPQHGQGVILPRGDHHAADGLHPVDSDLAVLNQFGDVGLGESRGAGRRFNDILACEVGPLGVIFHGSILDETAFLDAMSFV